MLQAGFAAVSITPEAGAALDGFIARLGPSTGIDLPLAARALWLESGGVRALIIGLDLLGLSPATADRMASLLADDLGLASECVILACTHTHSGPMSVRLRGLGEADEAYLARLEQDVRRAAAQAEAAKQSVRLAWGTAPVSIGINRRENVPGRGVVLGQNAGGPTDRLVRVASFRGPDTSIVLFVHAAHPYCLGGDSNLISPDFFGHAAQALEQQGHAAIYLNGCAGDIAPRRGFGGPEAAHEEGGRLAEAVLRACGGAREDDSPVLRVASRGVAIPYDTMPGLNELEERLGEADRTVRADERGNPEVARRLKEAGRQWLSELREALEAGGLPPVEGRISVAGLGGGALAVLPGENFFQTGRRIASRLLADPVCAASYGHGYIGYVPTPEACTQGGYEVDESHRYVGWWRLNPLTPAVLEGCVVSLWQELGGQTR